MHKASAIIEMTPPTVPPADPPTPSSTSPAPPSPFLIRFPHILHEICSHLRHPELALMLRVNETFFDIAGAHLYRNLVVVQTRRSVASPLSTFSHVDYAIPTPPKSPSTSSAYYSDDATNRSFSDDEYAPHVPHIPYTFNPQFEVPHPSPFKRRLLDMMTTMDISELAVLRLANSHHETQSKPLPLPNLTSLVVREADWGVYKKLADYQHVMMDIAEAWRPERVTFIGSPTALHRFCIRIDLEHREDMSYFDRSRESTWPSVLGLHLICPLSLPPPDQPSRLDQSIVPEPFDYWQEWSICDAFPHLTSYTVFYDIDARARPDHYSQCDTPITTFDWYYAQERPDAERRRQHVVASQMVSLLTYRGEKDGTQYNFIPDSWSPITYLPAISGAALRDPAMMAGIVSYTGKPWTSDYYGKDPGCGGKLLSQ